MAIRSFFVNSSCRNFDSALAFHYAIFTVWPPAPPSGTLSTETPSS
jgi:hypothetical protein